jgi:hypothetical protein
VTGPAAAQIVTENAGVISPELTILRESVAEARSENLDEVPWYHQLIFAPDRADEFRLTVPLVLRTARFDPGGGEQEAHQAGLGDVAPTARGSREVSAAARSPAPAPARAPRRSRA